MQQTSFKAFSDNQSLTRDITCTKPGVCNIRMSATSATPALERVYILHCGFTPCFAREY